MLRAGDGVVALGCAHVVGERRNMRHFSRAKYMCSQCKDKGAALGHHVECRQALRSRSASAVKAIVCINHDLNLRRERCVDI